MKKHRSASLPEHNSQNYNGPIKNWSEIPEIKTRNLIVHDTKLSGDAPKRVISYYNYQGPSPIRKINKNSWPVYVAKTAEKWHPIEGLTEYLINIIGQRLGLVINEVDLLKHKQTIWFLSRYFLSRKNKEALLHGTEICGAHLEDQDLAKEIADNYTEARDLFTFEFISEAVRSIFPKDHTTILEGIVQMLTFDCLLGNNDRHFYNWAVIYSYKQKKVIRLAPIYDSSRGLFWNVTDPNIARKAHRKGSLQSYVNQYAKNSRPRMTCEHDKKVNHFGLIKHITSLDERYHTIASALATTKQQGLAIQVAEEFGERFFSSYRTKAITMLLEERFNETRNALS